MNSITPNASYFVGVDVGGTNVDILLVNKALEVCGVWSEPIRQQSKVGPVAVITAGITSLLAEKGLTSAEIAAIGVGVPGQVEAERGEVHLAVNLETPTLPLGHILASHFGVPVFVENDGNAVTLGTYRFVAEPTVTNMAFVTLGTGVGAGVILNGQLYRGSRGMAGEIGHIVVEAESQQRCQCGNYGCLETFVAGPAIVRHGRLAAATQETVLRDLEEITAKDVFTAAEQGDAAAGAIVEMVGRYLGRALQALMMSYDVDRIFIGGGLSRAGQTLLRPIVQEWERQRALSDMARTMLDPAVLQIVAPAYQAGAWGAVAVAVDGFQRKGGLMLSSRQPNLNR